MPAPFVWFDLTTAGVEDVRAFYADLFGWTIGPGLGDYVGWMTDGEQPMADQIADPLRDHRALLLSPSCPGSHRHGLPVDLQDPASHL